MRKTKELKKISVVAMLSAVAYLCVVLFKFKIGFLTFDLKDVFLVIISFLYGPLYAISSAFLVAVLEFISISDTGFYGLIMNALSSMAFAGVAGVVYKYKRTFAGAIIGSVIAVLSMVLIMLCANVLITPYYMGAERSEVIAMIPTMLLPFNFIKGAVNMSLTLILYKPFTLALRKVGLIEHNFSNTNKVKFWILTAVSLVIVIACFLLIFLILGGKIEWGIFAK
ncbi:MAG: ECF transporter S component [Clostridia bacterium]|nr:ECF transporter S component [Clostridia bacterium]